MKTRILTNRRARLLAISLALSAVVWTTPQNVIMAQEANKNNLTQYSEKAKGWQEKMSEAFRDAWRGLGADKNAKSMTTSSMAVASVDLREQEDSYTVRLNLPNRNLDKVEIDLNQDTLNINAPAEGKIASYQQAITLTGVTPKAKPQIERKRQDGLIVVTVPKTSTRVTASAPPLIVLPRVLDTWDEDVLAQMWRMQRQMDRIFEEGFSEFRAAPNLQGYFNQLRFGSSVDMQEEKGQYVVRAYLPNRNMNNVNVTVKDQTLTIEAKAENGTKEKDGSQISEKAYYSQFLTLPGPVNIDKMKVDKKEDMLIITLPKHGANPAP